MITELVLTSLVSDSLKACGLHNGYSSAYSYFKMRKETLFYSKDNM